MGTITKGILGGFSGKVGTVIGGRWKGIDYMRSVASRRRDAQTLPQLEQRARFRLMLSFLQPIFGLLMVGFRTFALRKTGINAAMSYNLKNAIAGEYPLYSIAYNQVLISRGDLTGAVNASVTSLSSGELSFSWIDNSGIGKAKGSDRVILLAYCAALKASIYTTGSGLRSAMELSFDVADFAGETVQTWIGFISADGKSVSDSVFVGQVSVLE
ncbi:MAG: hypothetical protein INR69_15275 [Mucilaginibacter polytrichastri]|nr:hypothetical protein [Mucilaginibacter polytrichastri]